MGWEGRERAGKMPLKNSTSGMHSGHFAKPEMGEMSPDISAFGAETWA